MCTATYKGLAHAESPKFGRQQAGGPGEPSMKLQTVSKCKGRRKPMSQIKDRQAEGVLLTLCVFFCPSAAWVRPTMWGGHLRTQSSRLIQNHLCVHNTTEPPPSPAAHRTNYHPWPGCRPSQNTAGGRSAGAGSGHLIPVPVIPLRDQEARLHVTAVANGCLITRSEPPGRYCPV